ncbi:hypothetical protein ABID22_002160 [Pontibacter aydingkolensis]|uniref:Uncharacterized protein n=1 Tax=Pontibacter aydingkolensis TaxID=1911536 RepID=A0ABS7CVG7_9BACT|nr:hypothetical protein [Pontibacter aydingkolensis]MBW7467773.1 hypothetical protein [Pontibacter aydingkolensis]
MKQEQFYYCLSRILKLREKIEQTYLVRRNAQAIESAQTQEQQVGFDSLKLFAENKENADKNTAEEKALIKELAAQEAKIRTFVPVALYGTRIEATLPGHTTLNVVIEIQSIVIEKATQQI